MPGWCLPPSATACQEFLSEMLTELRIENFAIIQRLELSFGTGLLAFIQPFQTRKLPESTWTKPFDG